MARKAKEWAKEWAKDYVDLEWSTFKQRLLATFNTDNILRQLEGELHTVTQQADEQADTFITKKERIARRLRILVTPHLLQRIAGQLQPHFRLPLLQLNAQNLSDLSVAAHALQVTLQSLPAPLQPQICSSRV